MLKLAATPHRPAPSFSQPREVVNKITAIPYNVTHSFSPGEWPLQGLSGRGEEKAVAVEWGRLNRGGFSESAAGWLEQCGAGMAVS